MTRPFLLLESLDKSFGDQVAVRELSLEVREGEMLALLGPSGSGKTTVLRLLGGFEAPDRGRIVIGGEDITDQVAERRRFGMVFQHYALFPHLRVGGNVAFGLQGRGRSRAEVRRRVREVLQLVDLEGYEDRGVAELSGGEQQRVAVARALAPEPRVLLLDEPLSNLDPSLRERTRRSLDKVVRQVGITTVLVTHEQEEAFELGERVAVLHQGRLQQVGRPEELYEAPANRFVARFVGRASELPGELLDAATGQVSIGHGRVCWSGVLGEALGAGDQVALVLRPEAVALTSSDSVAALPGRVVGRRFAGSSSYYRIELGGGGEVEVKAGARSAREGQEVWVALRPGGPAPRIFRRPAGG